MASVRLEKSKSCYKHTQRWRYKARKWATAYAGSKCQGCAYDKYYGNLAFHHLGDKDACVSRLINKCSAWNIILTEIDKCVLVCHNCHGEIHAGIRICPSINLNDREKNLKLLVDDQPVPLKHQLHPCAVCRNPISKTKKYCNQVCAHKSLERTKWPSNLLDLVNNSSAVAVARMLGVSDKAVAKRLDKHRVI